MKLSSGPHFFSPTLVLHVLDAPEPGPTALIQAGIHGNEVAGSHALFELLEEGIRPDRGRLILCPVMNPAAYRARQRTRPSGLDLNRCFPGDADSAVPELRMAARFLELVEAERPALVVTLHESLKRFHPEIPQSFGQTVVYGVKPMPAIVETVVARMNRALESPYELWAPHYCPVATSSTEVIVERIGCIGLCVETWEGFEEGRRVRMQREIVRYLLQEMKILGA